MSTQTRDHTFLDIIQQRVQQNGHMTAIRRCILGSWEPVSWREWWLDSERFSTGLFEIGVRPGDRILVLSQTRYEWIVLEIATQMMGTPSVAIFPTTTPENLAQVIEASQPRFAIIEDPKQLAKFEGLHSSIQKFVILEVEATLDTPNAEGHSDIKLDEKLRKKINGDVLLYDEVIALGRKALAENQHIISEIRPMIRSTDTACIMYTSGTTGEKRGVVITHANIMAQLDALSKYDFFRQGETQLLSLPLAHIFVKVLLWFGVKKGVETAVGTGIRTLIPDALAVKPHVIGLVPSLVERFEKEIEADFEKFGSIRLKMMNALWSKAILAPGFHWRQEISSKIGRSALHRLFGERIRCFITGGANLDPSLIGFFNRIGIDVVQSYGLAETTGIVSIGENLENGATYPVQNADITLSDEGEIFVRGPMIAQAYFNVHNKDETCDEHGWLHTQDLGEFQEDGGLKILGRLGDLIITSGGRKIEPVAIEIMLEKNENIQRAFICGDSRPYVVALLETKGQPSLEEIVALILKVNLSISTSKTIREFRLIEEGFSIERGELTTNGSFRRDTIRRTRAVLIETMYS